MKKLLACLLTLMLCFPFAQAETVLYVDGDDSDRVHLRVGPSSEEESLGLYLTGTPVILLENAAEDWCWVRIGAETGCMMRRYLTQSMPESVNAWRLVDNPNGTWVNLRLSPSMDGLVALCPDNGELVQVLGETSTGWSYVAFGSVTGYMVTDYLAEIPQQRTTILGTTADRDYIHRYTAPGGEEIYLTALEEEPPIVFRDVNFDGMADIVVFVSLGASNFFAEFFVYDKASDTYVRAEHPGIDYGICNYGLDPELGIVHSGANNGYAGALHEDCLFRWEGNELVLIRRAVSEEWTERSFEAGIHTQVTHSDVLHITVRDYQADEYGGTLIFEAMVSTEDADFRDTLTKENEALWQGLR
ncbi:MAG: hypothetical protein IJ438_07105 [Clostridia bacterium]|nr:hypothetical protein [Clostridia bacterium]